MVLSAILLAATLQTKVASVTKIYDRDYAKKLVPMLTEVISFPTTQFDAEGHAAQKAWLAKTAHDLGFTYRDAGLISEIELPGPPNAPPPAQPNPNDTNLVDNLARLKLPVDRILPLHGRVVPVTELYAAVGQSPPK